VTTAGGGVTTVAFSHPPNASSANPRENDVKNFMMDSFYVNDKSALDYVVVKSIYEGGKLPRAENMGKWRAMRTFASDTRLHAAAG
jgi:hypothetical protein